MALAIKAILSGDLGGQGTRFGSLTQVRADGVPRERQGVQVFDGQYGASNRKIYTQLGTAQNHVYPSGTVETWTRFKFRLAQFPDSSGDGYSRIVGCGSSVSAESTMVVVDPNGELTLWTLQSSAWTKVATASGFTMAKDTWYTFKVFFRSNRNGDTTSPYDSDAHVIVIIDDTSYIDYEPGTTLSKQGIHQSSVYGAQYTFWGTGSAASVISFATDACYSYYDSVVCYTGTDVDTPPDGYVMAITPTSVDDAGSWSLTYPEQAFRDGPGEAYTIPYTSTTSEDIAWFALPSFASLGVSGDVRYMQVHYESAGLTGCSMGVDVSGTPEWQAAIFTGSGSCHSTRMTSVADADTDTIKIGIKKDATGTSRGFSRIWLEIECENYTRPTPNADVYAYCGSYVGNGTEQEIVAGAVTGFEPTWVWVWPITVSGHGHMKFSSANAFPSWSCDVQDGRGSENYKLPRFTSSGFTVWGNDTETNKSGETYGFLAIRDAYQRVFKYGFERFWSGLDDMDVNLAQAGSYASYTPELLIAHSGSRATATNLTLLRWTGHTGDQTNLWNASVAGAFSQADFLQSMGADAFQYGNLAGAYSPEWLAFLAIRDTAFQTNTLWQVFTYTGTGSGSPNRTVTLPASMSAASLAFVMVQPLTLPTGLGPKGGAYACLDNTAGKSTGMSSPSEHVYGIVDITTPGQFDVANDVLNDSGITYAVWAIANGSDAADPPTDMTFPPTPGSIPPWDITWPDDLPGLLGVKFYALPYNPGATVLDPWEYGVKCEQRQFPVDEQAFEFNVACDQRQWDALIGDSEGVK